jgi:2-haloacid dehalogenase
MPFDPALVRAISFDAVGTLFDWREGARASIHRLLYQLGETHGVSFAHKSDAVHKSWVRAEEHALLTQDYRPYDELLQSSLSEALTAHHVPHDSTHLSAFSASVESWPAFLDVPDFFEQLGEVRPDLHENVALVTNAHRPAMLRAVQHQMPYGLRPLIVTADDVEKFKPHPAPFTMAARQLKLAPGQILHVSGSAKTDLARALLLGFPSVFLSRYGAEGESDVPEGTTVIENLHDLLGLVAPRA